MNLIYAWLVLAIVAVIVEILSPTFGAIFVSFAAGVAAACAALHVGVAGQIGAFAVALLGSLAVLRPPLLRLVRSAGGGAGVPSRTERLVGMRARVIEGIDPVTGAGRVQIAGEGEDWAARSDAPIAAGAEVVIDGADGIVLTVSAVE